MADRTAPEMMVDWFQGGMTIRQISELTGRSISSVRHHLIHNGCDTSPPVAHPLDPLKYNREGIRQGKSITVSRAVGERIASEAARHGCTLWEAVDRLLRE